MNKADLIETLNEKIGGTKASSEIAVDTIFETISNQLKEGNEVSIAGFGIFSVKNRAARQARNPKTGETVQVPATRVPKFRPAKALKEAVK
jgi:DNA-binding protein HU-beta